MVLPKNAVEVTDLTLIFNVRDEGMHLKVNRDDGGWYNVCATEWIVP